MERIGVLILAAGRGSRMNGTTPKQFLEVNGKTLLRYSIDRFMPYADTMVIVTAEEYVSVVSTVCDQYTEDGTFEKKIHVTAGGGERYESSLNGLKALEALGGYDIVLIHDAARPLIDNETIERVIADVKTYGAAVASVPAKDTIRIADTDGFASYTPNRTLCWCMQTPQGFTRDIITRAYDLLPELLAEGVGITDDAMLAERLPDCKVRLTMGSYDNIKITTPEDLVLAKERLGEKC